MSGNGRIAGAVTVANSSTAVLYPNSSATLTISNNLTFSGSSSGVKFDLSSSAAGANDKVVVTNNTLACGGAQITISSAGTLDANDYVLFDVVGAAGNISGSFNSLPAWSGTTPKYASGHRVLTIGKQVLLRYSNPIPITVTAANNIKVYDGTTNATAVPTKTAGTFESGDSLNPPWTEAYSDKHVGIGTKTLTPIPGTIKDAGAADVTARYAITLALLTTGTINKTNLTVTAAPNTKPYDGTTNATATPTITAGSIQAGDTAPAWTESYDTPAAGTGKTLTPAGTVNDGNGGLNYNYTYATVATGVITARPTTCNLTSAPNPSGPGTNVTFTATVDGAPPLAEKPTGDVVFSVGAVPFSTNALVTGVAVASTASLPVGTNAIQAQYVGDGNFLTSSGNLDQVVKIFGACSQTNAILAIANNLDGTSTLTFMGTPQADYYVLASPDVAVSMGGWLPVVGSTNTVTNASGLWQLTVTNTAPQQFYRAAAVAPCP